MIGIIIIWYFTQGFICYNCRCQCFRSRPSWTIGQSVLEQDSEAHMAPDGISLARVSVWIALCEQVAPLTSATGVYKCAREELACVANGSEWRANGEKWFPKRCSCFHSSPLAGAASFIRHAGEKLALQCVEALRWVTETELRFRHQVMSFIKRRRRITSCRRPVVTFRLGTHSDGIC